jgi:hypothetical protein
MSRANCAVSVARSARRRSGGRLSPPFACVSNRSPRSPHGESTPVRDSAVAARAAGGLRSTRRARPCRSARLRGSSVWQRAGRTNRSTNEGHVSATAPVGPFTALSLKYVRGALRRSLSVSFCSVVLTRRLRAAAAQMKRSVRATGCRQAHNDGNQICVGLILVVIDLGFRVTFPSPRSATPALVIAAREIAAISARRLGRSGERQVHRRIEAFDSFGVAARRVLPGALSLPNKGSIIGSCHERSSVCSATPIRAGASPAERVAGHYRASGEQPTQPLRRRCAALTGAKPAGTTDSPNSAPAAQLAHTLRGAPALSDTAPARHRHRRGPPGHTLLTYPTPITCPARRDISAELR